MTEHPKVAVIGAGVAGLACAAELARADLSVTVLERARGLGGRLATRRHGELAFDHGAQFMTARSRPFVKYVTVSRNAGAAAAWTPSILEDDHRNWDTPLEDWYVGTPGMSSVVRPLARGLTVQTGTFVRELLRRDNTWELETDTHRRLGPYDAVVVAVPAPQALSLLAPHGRAFRHLISVHMAPCWSLMVSFERALKTANDVFRWTRGPLGLATRESSKPGRPADPSGWVIHAAAQWSREHLEADAQEAAQLMLHAFATAVGNGLPAPAYLQAHRWRHAMVEQSLGLPCLLDDDLAAGACGDWCIAPRVEAAFESGHAMAHSMLSILDRAAPITRA
ncbi:MAG TPA: FAD-dependent oxidoreductase [Steroidobacteraceae bacterium]